MFEGVKEAVFPKSGAKKKYDLTSDRYHLIMGVFEIKPNLKALELAKIKKSEKILDIAFGTGWYLKKIIPLVGSRIHGIDFSSEMHRVARETLKRSHREKQAALVQGNVLSMPYKDESFDVAFASFILDLQKIADIPKLLSEIRRILKPKGRMVIVAMTKEGKGLLKAARYFYEWLYDRWPTIFGYRVSSRPIYVDDAIKKAGFLIKKNKLTHIKFFYFPIKIVVAEKNRI